MGKDRPSPLQRSFTTYCAAEMSNCLEAWCSLLLALCLHRDFCLFTFCCSVGLIRVLACGSAGGALSLGEENDAFPSSSLCGMCLLARLSGYTLWLWVMNRCVWLWKKKMTSVAFSWELRLSPPPRCYWSLQSLSGCFCLLLIFQSSLPVWPPDYEMVSPCTRGGLGWVLEETPWLRGFSVPGTGSVILWRLFSDSVFLWSCGDDSVIQWSKVILESSAEVFTVCSVKACNSWNSQLHLPSRFALSGLGKVSVQGCMCKGRGGDVLHLKLSATLLTRITIRKYPGVYLPLHKTWIHLCRATSPALACSEMLLALPGMKHLEIPRAVKPDICQGSERKRISPQSFPGVFSQYLICWGSTMSFRLIPVGQGVRINDILDQQIILPWSENPGN